ncbi:MAG: hypothetical protein MJ067_06530, partial [Oscillospiraceae bacterium]|nr:hypothetical protein [Oscillospiraceae bacterium]
KSASKPEQKKQPKPKNNKNLKKELRTKLLAVERSIAGAEEAIAQCDRDAEEYATDYAKLTEIYTLRQQKEQELEELMARWEELGSLLEQEE